MADNKTQALKTEMRLLSECNAMVDNWETGVSRWGCVCARTLKSFQAENVANLCQTVERALGTSKVCANPIAVVARVNIFKSMKCAMSRAVNNCSECVKMCFS
jgi:hypothetical protein